MSSRARAKTGADRYFERRAQSAEFREEYDAARRHIDAVDQLIRDLDQARMEAGLSKAELARRAEMTPEVVRRIFTSRRANPTLDTLVRLAQAAGADLHVGRGTTAVRRSAKRATSRRSASA